MRVRRRVSKSWRRRARERERRKRGVNIAREGRGRRAVWTQ